MNNHYDVVVVGGGITGAGIYRDLSLHGVNTLLIDKKDFGSQTSHMSSKMFHGGIRYMESGNFGLVWEALHEKNLWLGLAPHLCRELPFYMPVFKDSKYPLWMMNLAFTAYDALSAFKNSNHRSVNRDGAIRDIPHIKQDKLCGSAIYYDAIVDDMRLTLESIFDGQLEPNSDAHNYHELININRTEKGINLTIKDTLTNEEYDVITNDVVFATGPFTDQELGKLTNIPWKDRLLPSKGSHIWLKKEALPLCAPVVIQTVDKRIIFVIPHHDSILVGTTEEKVDGNFYDIQASKREIDYILDNLRSYFPTAIISKEQILSSFAGVRPLVKIGNSGDLGKTARNHKIITPFSNVHIIIGGKLTTFRTMGQKISRKICKKNGIKYCKNKTKQPFRKKTVISAFEPLTSLTQDQINQIVSHEMVKTFEDLVKRRLGIPSKRHWQCKESFEDFFSKVNVLAISQKEIENYPT